MRIVVAAAFAIVAIWGGTSAPAEAQGLPPFDGRRPPPFSALSNNVPLIFGMDAEHTARASASALLHQGPSGRGNLPGVPRHRRQRIVSAPPPALSAIPRRPAGRLEGRLGP